MTLKELREKRGLKQNYVANQIGIKQSTLSNWESGKRDCSIENLLKLVDVYNVPLESLIVAYKNTRLGA